MENIHLDKCQKDYFFYTSFNTVRHMRSLCPIWSILRWFSSSFWPCLLLHPSWSLSFSVCCILIFCMDHFSVIHIFIDPLKADKWKLFVRDGFHPYMAASLPGSTRNSSDSDINTDYPVSMEMNEPELTDGLRRAKRQVRVFIFDISWSVFFFFFLKISHAQQAAERANRNRFQPKTDHGKALYWAQEFLTEPCMLIS